MVVSDVLYIRSVSAMEAPLSDACVSKSIVLRMSESDVFPAGKQRLVMDQAYVLSIKPERKCITVTGTTSTGVFYGAVSLVSLLQGTVHTLFILTS